MRLLAVAPDLLDDVARGRRVVIVSATNGKTTTTRLLAEALRASGVRVVSNSTGANMPAGVAAALGRDRESEVAVLEVDERWVPRVVDPLGTELLVLGNLTRDELDRFGEVRSIATAGARCATRIRSWRSWRTRPTLTSSGPSRAPQPSRGSRWRPVAPRRRHLPGLRRAPRVE